MVRLISVHVAKAGGSSTRELLRAAFGSRFMEDYNDNPADPVSRRTLDPAGYARLRYAMPDDKSCIHGHFHPAKYNIADDMFLFTMLRHPVDNIMSIFWFWKTFSAGTEPLHSYFLAQNLSVVETAKLPILRRLFSETYFGGFDMSRFNLVGRHEAREDTLHTLSQRIGIPFDVTIRENVTPDSGERLAMAENPMLRRQLEDVLADDIRFYERYAR
ncbi:MAG: hypothetical protein KGQ26_02910 [Rhodospirillales bacterium]|nr:hypothetical protein [Rhodospirillales bacterium]MDE2318373.1 hypothetical protein [Rhodospirillales bacterium]